MRKRPTLSREILTFMISESIKKEEGQQVFFTAYQVAKGLTKRNQLTIVKEVLERMSDSSYSYDESHEETHFLHDGSKIIIKEERQGKDYYALNPDLVNVFIQNDAGAFSQHYKELITNKGLDKIHEGNKIKKKTHNSDKSKSNK